MTVQGVVRVVSMAIGQNLIKINMKKSLLICTDCGDDTSILTQVSSGPEVIMLCIDCYNYKYSKEIENKITYVEKK